MSLMYRKKSIGPRTEPYGTPDVTSVMSDRAPLTETVLPRRLLLSRRGKTRMYTVGIVFEFDTVPI